MAWVLIKAINAFEYLFVTTARGHLIYKIVTYSLTFLPAILFLLSLVYIDLFVSVNTAGSLMAALFLIITMKYYGFLFASYFIIIITALYLRRRSLKNSRTKNKLS